MKILLDARAVGVQPHGIGRYTLDLIQGLLKQGHGVDVIYHLPALPASISQLLPSPIGILYLPSRFASIWDPWHLAKINIKWNLNKYDIIHFPSFSMPLSFAPIPWGKVIITLHDTIHLLPPPRSENWQENMHNSFKRMIHWTYYFFFVFRGLHKARGVIAVSEWTRSKIIELFNLPKDRVVTVRNGLGENWIKNHSTEGAANKIRQFISLSNLKPHKNLTTLILASRLLWKEGHDFNLALSLSGAEIPEEWALLPEEISKIKILHRVPEEELRSELESSLALISPSFYEGFDYPVAEALATGTPVIISKGSAHDEFHGPLVQVYGEPADVFHLKNKMKEALNTNSAPAAFSHNVLDLQTMTENTVKAYGKTRGH